MKDNCDDCDETDDANEDNEEAKDSNDNKITALIDILIKCAIRVRLAANYI